MSTSLVTQQHFGGRPPALEPAPAPSIAPVGLRIHPSLRDESLPLLVICPDERMGDVVCLEPALSRLAAQKRETHFVIACETVGRLFPPEVLEHVTLDAVMPGQYAVLHLGARFGVAQLGCDDHPTRMLLRLAGFELEDDAIPQPRLRIPQRVLDGAPQWDILIAPFSRDSDRALSTDAATALMLQCLKRSPKTAVLGGAGDPALYGGLHPREYGKPLEMVLAMMLKAKVVITVDSACNRLAHAAGIDGHVLLVTDYYRVPLRWQSHPKAHVVTGSGLGMKLADILATVDRLLERAA